MFLEGQLLEDKILIHFLPIFGDFRNVCQKKYVVLEVFFGAAKKVCDPACCLLGGPGRVGLGSGRPVQVLGSLVIDLRKRSKTGKQH